MDCWFLYSDPAALVHLQMRVYAPPMCTFVILRRPDHIWPVLIAANRDEMEDRPWTAPGRHWPDRPEVVAGQDTLAGGSWLGINDAGVVAGVLNRINSLGPAADKRSRGELVLDALDHNDAADAATAMGELDPAAYRPFNLAIADNRDAFWLRNTGDAIDVLPIGEGLHMLTAHDMDDTGSDRIANHRPGFVEAAVPDPDGGPETWEAWRRVLARRENWDGQIKEGAMNVTTDFGFGTVCSTFIALPAAESGEGEDNRKPVFLFAAGRPDEAAFEPVAL